MSVERLQRIGHKCYVKKIPFIPGICTILMRVLYSADFPVQMDVGKGVHLGHGGIGIVINHKAIIEKNVVIAQNVTIASNGGAPIIGEWTYIGANSVILGGGKNWKERYDWCFVAS